ncbi:MAG: ABC transporter substrate-binding protein, partial [Actinobacteria bacterium]|nr:ABC transporter substrate-binding protein [Actinomycetota bacterium]
MNDDRFTDEALFEKLDRAQFLRLSAVTAAGISFGGLAACAGGGASAADEGVRLAGGDWGYPSPFGYLRGPGYWRMSYIFDTLIWRDKSGKFIPWLATDWETPDKGLTWRFKLRRGVKWQDGRPLTARDVAFSYTYFGEKPVPPATIVRPQFVAGARASGDDVAEIKLAKPYAAFLRDIAGALPIIPEHIWKDVDEPAKFRGKQAVVGSGPYRLGSYSRADGSYLFTANKSFFLGKPYVSRIENVPVDNELLALKKGEIDAGGPPPLKPSKGALESFRENPDFGVLRGTPDFTLALYFNLTGGGALADPAFRRAVAYAVNREDAVKRALQGQGLPGEASWLPPSNSFYSESRRYPFDLAKARSELDAAGYRMAGDTRQGPDGRPLRFRLSFPAPQASQAAELVISYLKPLGVRVEPQALDEATLNERATKGNYELALVFYGGLGGDPDYMRLVFAPKVPQIQS